ncbi:MAG: tetratricopeptide repeat protein [Deltaproteobacteria bacterium]|nr:tetratricopeptide repeat protein [Deltaproteobacteria bacterium]
MNVRSTTLMVTTALALAAGAACDDAFLTTHGAVDRGNEALTQGAAAEAKTAYDEAAAELPETPELNYDRGLAALAAGEVEPGIELLLRALATKDPALLQRVNAALGLGHAKAALALERQVPAPTEPAPGDDPAAAAPEAAGPSEAVLDRWKKAVTFLTEALKAKPDDAESRRTLEVALLRVDPPCTSRDDRYEQNDVAGAPALLEPKAAGAEDPSQSLPPGAAPEPPPTDGAIPDLLRLQEQLFSCPDDDDWYALELAAGDRLKVALTVPSEAGKLTLTLQDPLGREVASGDVIRRTVGESEAGKWRLRVQNVELDEVSYGLEVEVRPACARTEDRFEDNDRIGDARLLTTGEAPGLKLCPGDEDWYAVDLADGESLFVYAQPTPDPKAEDDAPKKDPSAPPEAPPFALEIHDATGAVRGEGGPTGQALVSALLTPGLGRYTMRVSPRTPDWEGRYSLRVEIVPPCPEGDDRFEDNDGPEDATDFMQAAAPQGEQGAAPGMAPQQQQGPPVVFARVCPGDVDWWKVSDDGTKPAVWIATFDHAQGDLALTLFDEAGREQIAASDTSSKAQNAEAVPLPLAEKPADPDPNAPAPDPNAPAPGPDDAPPEAKTWTLRVAGVGEGQNFYLLRLERPQPQSGDGDSQDDQKDKQDQDDQKDEQDQADKDKQDQADKDKQDPSDEQKKEPQDQKSQPLQDALDKLDRNPENLEASESAKKSPLANHRPLKDW